MSRTRCMLPKLGHCPPPQGEALQAQLLEVRHCRGQLPGERHCRGKASPGVNPGPSPLAAKAPHLPTDVFSTLSHTAAAAAASPTAWASQCAQ